VTILRVRGGSAGPITGMWQNQNDASVQGICRKNNGPPFHHTLESHSASHTMAPAERKERSRVGGGAGARCRVLCQCSQQLELDPRLAGKVIIMPENMSDKPRVSGATQTASPEACEKGVLSRTSKLKWSGQRTQGLLKCHNAIDILGVYKDGVSKQDAP